jgi:hypothetical protein
VVKVKCRFLFLLLGLSINGLFLSFSGNARETPDSNKQPSYFFSQVSNIYKRQLKLIFFAHNNPTIAEFALAKRRVSTIFSEILNHHFEPKVETAEVGLAPLKMEGGNVVNHNGKLYIATRATDDEIEAGLLDYFEVFEVSGRLIFFAHNRPTIAQFYLVKRRVESVLKRFGQYGLKVDIPSLEIGAVPVAMAGGQVVEHNGKVYIASTASEEKIEAYFTRYITGKRPAQSLRIEKHLEDQNLCLMKI